MVLPAGLAAVCTGRGAAFGAGYEGSITASSSANTRRISSPSCAFSVSDGIAANHAHTVMRRLAASIFTSVTYALSSPPAQPESAAHSGNIVRNGVCCSLISSLRRRSR